MEHVFITDPDTGLDYREGGRPHVSGRPPEYMLLDFAAVAEKCTADGKCSICGGEIFRDLTPARAHDAATHKPNCSLRKIREVLRRAGNL